MRDARVCIWLVFALCFGVNVKAQRVYSSQSVLASGNWYKISVDKPGIYKIDIPFLQALGINANGLDAGAMRVYGNGGGQLGESNNGVYTDDLKEVAVWVEDGGDGVLNGSDHILFFAQGPHHWIKDSLNRQFDHQLNKYSDVAYYFLSVSAGGKRILSETGTGAGSLNVTTYDGRFFHELDAFNFLSSGKEWYGEEFSGAPGKTLSRTFSLQLPTIQASSGIRIRTKLLARSAGNGSGFHIRINQSVAAQASLSPVSGGLYDPVAIENSFSLTGNAVTGTQQVRFDFQPGSFNAQGWLNWFEVFYRGDLSMSGVDQLLFRDWSSVGTGSARFILSNAGAAVRVWDVTDASSPVAITGNYLSGQFTFSRDASRLREYVAFNPTNYLLPKTIGRVNNQDLHQPGNADMLIICPPEFLTEARRLAAVHSAHDGLRSIVATTEQVYNEFSSGTPDPVAIRDFVKMFFDRYAMDPQKKLRYLLLFGDASFDFRGRMYPAERMVPSYQNSFSLDPLNTYVSDDFFGFLEDHEDINSGLVINLLDVGVGRVPVSTVVQAKQFVDKLSRYLSPSSFGAWRTQLTLVADDEDNNLHLNDAEQMDAAVSSVTNLFNRTKIYLDSYFQETGPGGARYPQANQASNNRLHNGTLIWNYNGHGGSRRLAEETVFDQQAAEEVKNDPRLPLFITATCDFAPFDDPRLQSLGENILLRPHHGAIALMTTTRVVFAFSNRVMNENYLRFALERRPDGSFRSLGEAVMDAKNFTYQNFGDITNNRKFTLLGDPALTLGFPRHRIAITAVNGLPAAQADTISAGENVLITGEIRDEQGALLPDFDGTIVPMVFDKKRSVQTRGNDAGSPVTNFTVQQNLLFKGKATVEGGRFSFQFKVPKDINISFGPGRFSLYADNGETDAAGVFEDVIVGGTQALTSDDDLGPDIKVFFNDEMFVNGGTVNETPVLIVKLADTSGINTTGLGIGHDLVATLDDDNQQYFILNDFYQSDLNDHTRGIARFQMPLLPPGPHSITIKAWDGMNNSSQARLDFIVARDEELMITHVLNFPNPFTTSTQFWFEHNKPGEMLGVKLEIMTITGRVVRSFSSNVVTAGNRFAGFEWDGRDEFGARLGRGVYLYRLRVTDAKGLKKQVLEKLAIL